MAEKKPIKKRPPRTPKEKRFAKEYIRNGGNATQAALAVYDTTSYKSASRIGTENTEKLSLVEYMDRIEGLRDQDLLARLSEGLFATRQVGATSMKTANEGTIDFVDVEDFAVRHKYLDLAFKLKGHLIQKQELSGPNGGPIQVEKVRFGLDSE